MNSKKTGIKIEKDNDPYYAEANIWHNCFLQYHESQTMCLFSKKLYRLWLRKKIKELEYFEHYWLNLTKHYHQREKFGSKLAIRKQNERK